MRKQAGRGKLPNNIPVFSECDRLVNKWFSTKRSFTKAREDVARRLIELGPTHLIEFVYILSNSGRGGLNHDCDELALMMEPKSQFYVGKKG